MTFIKSYFEYEDINYDDLLISSLISLAPKKIIIHRISQFTNKELLNTIFNIFLDKVIICTECELCYQNIVQNENKQ